MENSTVKYGKLPTVRVTAPSGAQAVVSLYGGHLLSWKTADGQERLFFSEKSALDGSRAIRGGVPVIFPQFAARGTGMRHGFARVSNWHLTETGTHADAAFARFVLTDEWLEPEVAAAWPHKFKLVLDVVVRADDIRLSLTVHNTGEAPFEFSGALHTYFLVDELGKVRIDGVQEGEFAITDKYDHIYFGVEGPLALRSGHGTLKLEQEGFPDAVIWNPGAADAAALVDMGDEEYDRFVCIEPATIAPRTLAPEESWRGWHIITAVPAE
ncbi:D-hexose-6-phosphate mutarotase [Massilia cavernae]|uniref:Putative glucose-6-phosphate 1-epimerase n=1 Tax=Massilia cavernae TaxID=2320864 RepID=A0A418XSY5_9BURK|nr:D-hexose-6-phosphate mutarotase [Massilia cavernae]RJG15675.1 D-hexose-6-phosphate mutarotase [Massilia cavernae]